MVLVLWGAGLVGGVRSSLGVSRLTGWAAGDLDAYRALSMKSESESPAGFVLEDDADLASYQISARLLDPAIDLGQVKPVSTKNRKVASDPI